MPIEKKIWKMKIDKNKNKTKILDDIETKPKLERILKEENLKNRVDPDFKNRAINHEKEHDENDRYLTAKYGKSVANRLYKMSEKAYRDSIKGKGEAYKNDPLEHNAFRAGAGKKDIQHSHEVLDRAAKGKKTPPIDDSDRIRQIYGNAPVNPKKTD